MLGVIWMCSLVSLISVGGCLYFYLEDKKTEKKEKK